MGRRGDDEGIVIEYNEEDVDQLMMMEGKQCRVEGESNEILDLLSFRVCTKWITRSSTSDVSLRRSHLRR